MQLYLIQIDCNVSLLIQIPRSCVQFASWCYVCRLFFSALDAAAASKNLRFDGKHMFRAERWRLPVGEQLDKLSFRNVSVCLLA